jgi:serine protease Do
MSRLTSMVFGTILVTLFLTTAADGQLPNFKMGGVVPTLAPLVRDVTPSVVNISVHGRIREDNPLYRDPIFREYFDVPKQLEKEINATGSGVVVDAAKGYVLTNNHVVEQVSTVQITTKDGRQFAARVMGRDPATDIAVLQINTPTSLKAMQLGDSDALEVGDFVIAIGNPFGLGQTVTSGLVSALSRTGLGKQGYEDFIQTDAAINPGNSGGALVNLKGELIGINSAIISPGGGNVGIGFAIPINMARRVMEQIVENGRVVRGRIGVSLQDMHPSSESDRSDGARIAEVASGSPAEKSGLRKGDVITKVDDRPIRNAAQLRNRIGLARIGEQVKLTFERAGISQLANVTVSPATDPPWPSTSRERSIR